MTHRSFHCMASAAIALCAAWPAVAPLAADHQEQVTVAGKSRTYSVHLPQLAAPPGGFPLVLAFHGGGMQGAAMRRVTGLDTVADARGFVVVYPDGVDKHWNDGRAEISNPQDDVGFVAAVLDEVARRFPVDQARIYATGLSNGALFAERLGCDMPERIAAIAPVAGTLPVDLAPRCRPARAVAVLHVNGNRDPIMPFGGGKVADFGGRGEGGKVLSVAGSAAFWARANGCGAAGPERMLAPLVRADPTRIVTQAYTGCPADGSVESMTVAGGGHAWPGGAQHARPMIIGKVSRQLDASAAIADFFLAQPRTR